MKKQLVISLSVLSLNAMADGPMCTYPKNVCENTEPEITEQVLDMVKNVEEATPPVIDEIPGPGDLLYDIATLDEQKEFDRQRAEQEKKLKDKKSTPFTSVDKFVQGLPESMRKNFILMAPSRSNQDGSVANPKVIMKSPNAEVIASFNSHGDQHGFEEVEMMVWNKDEKKYDMISIAFEEDSPKKEMRVKRNPQGCKECHGDPVRPQWDHPPMWTGQIPFAADTILPDSYDKKNYIKTLEEIEAAKKETDESKLTVAQKRMRALEPLLTSTQVKDAKGNLEIPHFDGEGKFNEQGLLQSFSCNSGRSSDSKHNGPGFKLYDQMQIKTYCQINNELKSMPNWNSLKYAAYAALKGCNMSNVIPATIQKNVQTFYQSQGFKAQSFDGLSNELTSQRVNLRQRVRDQREARQMWFTAENQKVTKDNFNSRSQFFQWASIGGNILSNFDDNNVNPVTSLRTLLEPMGVNMKSWSMSLDPNPMTFGDTFAELVNMGAFDDVIKEFGETPNCAVLEKKANKKLIKDKEVNETSERIAIQCAENPSLDLSLDGQLDQLAQIPQADLKKQAQEIFNKCTQCHGPEEKGGFSKELGLPVLDLFNLDDFEKDLADNREQTLTLIESMKDRIARPLGSVGSMPPTPPMKPLTDDERKIVIQYLNSLKNGQGSSNNQNGQLLQPGMGGGFGGGFGFGGGGNPAKPEGNGTNTLSPPPGGF